MNTESVTVHRPSRGHSTNASDIPTAPLYVAMTDRFMSGWGPAESMTNRHVVLCGDHAEAVAVAEAAKRRFEMRRVTVCVVKPRTRSGVLYSWSGPEGWLRDVPEDEGVSA